MNLLAILKQKASKLKQEVGVLRIAYTDKRTPFFSKLLIGLTVGYLMSPIDLIPDFIPVLGILDDLILVPILIAWSIRLIPTQVIIEARETLEKNPEIHRKKNWIFGGIVIIIWFLLAYLLYSHLSYMF
jgi:uncharacterized membrane protein YkvA (DUF1232 family)